MKSSLSALALWLFLSVPAVPAEATLELARDGRAGEGRRRVRFA